jgi:apolipoprotein N-acyltransferase
MTARQSRLLALVAGLLIALSMPPWGFWPGALLGSALFISLSAERNRDRFMLGLIFGISWFGPTTAWMYFLTAPGYVIAVVFFAALHACAAAIARDSKIAKIGAHSLVEMIRLVAPFGGIPLATLGISQANGPLLPVARLGGVPLLTLVVFTIGALVTELRATWNTSTRPSRSWMASATTVTALLAIAIAAPTGSDLEPINVAAIQGGGRQGTSALEVPSIDVTHAHLAASQLVRHSDQVDMVLWPENAIDVNRQPFGDSTVADLVRGEASRLQAPFVIGVTEDAEFVYDVEPGNFVNAQYVVMPDGAIGDRYVKVIKVPFGEYIPFRSLLESLGAPVGLIPKDAISGRGPAVVDVPDVSTLGVVISWEVFFGSRARNAVRSGGEIIVNPTNGASYTWTIVQSQQVASSRLRAVETGRWVLQVAPTGYSATVDPSGNVLERSEISEQRVLFATPTRRTGSTIYTRLGDLPFTVIAMVLTCLPLVWSRRSPSPGHRSQVTPSSLS